MVIVRDESSGKEVGPETMTAAKISEMEHSTILQRMASVALTDQQTRHVGLTGTLIGGTLTQVQRIWLPNVPFVKKKNSI